MTTSERQMPLDQVADPIIEGNINMTVPWYLMASFAYYEQDNPILTDMYFDALGKKMLARWDEITHFHKVYITIGDLQAGTFLGQYPSRVKYALDETRRLYGSNI